jgi:hypothetical protein
VGALKICLVQISGKEGQRSHLIDKPSFTVGRAQDADLPVLMPGASRLHLRVETKENVIYITDQNSANGTYVNGKPIAKGSTQAVLVSDIVRLGLEETEFTFQAIPKPFEAMGGDAKSAAVFSSMEDIAKQMEAKARASVEQEVKSAKLEAERILTQAKMEVESFRTHGLSELQRTKTELESENARLQQQSRMLASQERLHAHKEADLLMTEAQKQIQKDYDEATQQIEARLKDTQSRCFAMLEEADVRSRQIMEETQSEASRLRREAADGARLVQSEALRKSQGSLSSLQEDFAREMNDKRAAIKVEEVRLAKEREGIAIEVAGLRSEAEAARKILAQVEEMENRKTQAKEEFEKFSRSRAEGILKIDQELKEIRERQLLEIETRKRQLEQDVAKDKLRAFDDIKKDIERREEEYMQTRRMRALELSQRLQEKLVPRLKDWLGRPESASSEMKTSIELVVKETMTAESSTFQNIDVQAPGEQAPVPAKLKRVRKIAAITAGALVVIGLIFHQSIIEYLEKHGAHSYANDVVEKRKADSLYRPAQDDGYRDNYTDNVLYMKGYIETKTDPLYIEKWTLRLNDLGMLKSLKLSEEDIVRFIAKETGMVQRLGALRDSVDAVYLNEGLDRMRKAETEDLAEIRTILKTEEAVRKIRAIEKQSIEDFKAGK